MTEVHPTTVACTLPLEDRNRRRAEIRRDLVPFVLETRDLDDGLALRFPAERRGDVEAFVDFERGCCGFAGFEVRSSDDGVWLEIRGPAGTRDFARRMLDIDVADEPC